MEKPVKRHGPISSFRDIAGGIGSAATDGKIRAIFGLTFTMIFLAALFYRWAEGWSYLDAAYFSTVTISTVGFGDFTPKSDIGKLFTIFYIPVGLGLFVGAAGSLADHLIRYSRIENISTTSRPKITEDDAS